jgi:NAD(P)-dependent dehydrogenase (short-subunit alcohol dehydrogenase family)
VSDLAKERDACPSRLSITQGDRVVVSGAAGFIGSAVVRALLARGANVVALVEPASDARNLQGLEAIAGSARWFVENGYVAPKQAGRIRIMGPPPMNNSSGP